MYHLVINNKENLFLILNIHTDRKKKSYTTRR